MLEQVINGMIKTKSDLKYYLLCDKIARNEKKNKPSLFGDRLWKFQITYRKTEYYYNNRNRLLHKIMYTLYHYIYRKKCSRLCSDIPLNVFGEGLVIWHGQNIIINRNARVGKNCSISSGCCIGQAHNQSPTIGDNLEMTIGSKILGGIHICNDVTIGAGAVVVKDITEPYTTWGGVPAKCISHNINSYVQEKKERLSKIINN